MSQTIQVVHNPSQDVIDQAKSWPTWGCGVSKFPWTYDDNETAYVLKVCTEYLRNTLYNVSNFLKGRSNSNT